MTLAVSDWSNLLGVDIVFPLGALILNYLVYQSKPIPRFISVWGLVGATLWLATGLLKIFGFSPSSTISIFLFLPIALQEMFFAVWLIGKGFNKESKQ